MRHARFTIADLRVDDVPVVLQFADLVAARHDNEEGDVEWECVAATRQAMIYERGPHHLRMTTDDGRQLGGDVVLVRSHDRGHVFRGVGALDGLADDELGD